jgi:microsomal dipeptidase-like Zn-dependent dipeptidase
MLRRALVGLVALSSLCAAALATGDADPRPAAARGTQPLAGGTIESRTELANRCVAIVSAAGRRFVGVTEAGYATTESSAEAAALYLKPTGLGTYMIQDRGGGLMAVQDGAVQRTTTPGPPAEWRIRPAARPFTLKSTADGRNLAVDPATGQLVLTPAGGGATSRFDFKRARACTPFPEATAGTSGRPRKSTRPGGTVAGFADAHLHVTADLRAGGRVIHGKAFDPFGITEALGHDEDDHGPDGSLDVTGNLLRTGSPAGTHDTHGWPTFAGWPVHDTYTHQQTYYVWLKRVWRAGMRLVVAQTVEDEPLCEIEPLKSHSCDEMETVKLEIERLRALQDYVDAQSGGRGRGWLRIVTNPRQARRVMESGKLAVVIGMEVSNPFGCSEFQNEPQCTRDDIDAGLRELRRLGLRSMFIAHWTDNAFGGAAFEGGATGEFIGAFQTSSTGHPFEVEPCEHADESEGECNAKGLTDLGRYLVRRLIARHMLIETDHLSQKARAEVFEIAELHDYPLVSSHSGTGGEWTPEQLERLYALDGLATVRPGPAPEVAAELRRLRRATHAGRDVGVALGTDTGGFSALPGPRPDAEPLRYPFKSSYCQIRFRRQRTGERVFDLNTDGVAHYGLFADLIADVERQPGGRRALRPLFRSAEAYLQMWERAYGVRGGS